MDWKDPILNQRMLLRFLTKHITLYRAIFEFHEKKLKEGIISRGHSIEHDLLVCVHSLILGFFLENEKLAHRAGAAALMHSYDRFNETEKMVYEWVGLLPPTYGNEDKQEIVAAILWHDGSNKEGNVNFDTADILADADKLACLMAYNPLRSGQFDYNLPTVDLDHLNEMSPGANYKRHNTVLDNIYGMFEWFEDKEKWFKTPLARKIAEEYEKPFRQWLSDSISQFKNLGLDSIPDPNLIC